MRPRRALAVHERERSRRPIQLSASAEAVGSWIRRLSHHHMTPCELCDAQGPARRPHRRVWSLGCEVDRSGVAGDESLKSDPSIGNFPLGRGLATKTSTAIKSLMLK